MKKLWLLAFAALVAFQAQAQKKKKDDIDYYTDSKVKESKFAIDALLLPNYTDRRLINDEIPAGGGLDLNNDEADGTFNLNYHLDVIYALGSAFDISLGVGYVSGSYSFENADFYADRPDTTTVDVNVDVSLITLPFKLNFNTAISDAFILEVVPSVEVGFMQSYQSVYSPVDGSDDIRFDYGNRTNDVNYLVGISLGGTFYLTERLGLVVRGNIKYMLNPMIEQTDFPRETLYFLGLNTGLRYNF
jgi:hypothetical protein